VTHLTLPRSGLRQTNHFAPTGAWNTVQASSLNKYSAEETRMAPLVRTRRRLTSTASVRILPRILSQGFIPRFPPKPFELSGGDPLE
jgi:hypothetical protein